MGISKRVSTIAAGVGALAMVGTGIAHAVIADPVPGPSYTMCGTVYAGAPMADNHPSPNSGIPDTATVVQGVKVTGKLFEKGNPVPVASYGPVTSGANGQFCLTGNAGMVGAITGGGNVTLSVSTPLPAPYTTTTVSHGGVIDQTAFLNHRVGGIFGTQATGFNVVVS